MKITIIGPGAMGCLFGGFLAKNPGNEVWLLDKDPARASFIKTHGIKIEGISGKSSVRINAAHSPDEIGACDLIILCVKSYDTDEAIKSAKGLISNDTLILTLQNGIGNIERIGKGTGIEKVLGGVTSQGATLLGVGNIRHAGKGETVIGRAVMGGSEDIRLEAVSSLLNDAGLETKVSQNVERLLWSKLIINVGINALTAITRLHNGKLIKFSGTREILKMAVLEAVEVSQKRGIILIYEDPVNKVESVCEATAPNISSMLQDVMRKKRTEIEFINGAIVDEGKKYNVPTPVNEVLTNLVRTIEMSYKEVLC